MALFTTVPPNVTPLSSLIKLLTMGEVSAIDFSHRKSRILKRLVLLRLRPVFRPGTSFLPFLSLTVFYVSIKCDVHKP